MIDFHVQELPASKATDSAKQQGEECDRILKILNNVDGDVWVLDERGKAFTTVQFAHELSKATDRGTPLTFVLGGAYGLTDDVRKKGKLFQLSAMTLPHELCRVVFLEQLYRACEVNKGSGYHH
jgi:23S rRNA (pseudouridine1915-N3)-methyltransferase